MGADIWSWEHSHGPGSWDTPDLERARASKAFLEAAIALHLEIERNGSASPETHQREQAAWERYRDLL